MKKVFIDTFCGQEVLTTIWDGNPCWFASKIAEILDYDDPSKAIAYCLKVEEFDVGIDYEILSGTKLKEFKSLLKENDVDIESLKYVSKLIIFYEDGLFGFLQFSHKPIGAKLRKWVRAEVKPKIMSELGLRENVRTLSNDSKVVDNTLSLVEGKSITIDRLNNDLESNEFDIDKFQRLRLATESAKMIKGLLDDVDTDSICKLAVIKALFLESGINLPIYFNKKD